MSRTWSSRALVAKESEKRTLSQKVTKNVFKSILTPAIASTPRGLSLSRAVATSPESASPSPSGIVEVQRFRGIKPRAFDLSNPEFFDMSTNDEMQIAIPNSQPSASSDTLAQYVGGASNAPSARSVSTPGQHWHGSVGAHASAGAPVAPILVGVGAQGCAGAHVAPNIIELSQHMCRTICQ